MKRLILIFKLSIIVNIAKSLNFDIDNPIIYTDPSPNSAKPNYFGYSVILYNDTNKPWIQISAPRGGYGIQPMGQIFRCPVAEKCNELKVHVPYTNQVNGLLRKEHAGMWIGNSMDIHIPSGRSVVCSHRYINFFYYRLRDDFFMQGACYYWANSKDEYPKPIMPLANDRGNQIYNNSAYMYANAQSGFSAHFTNSKDSIELFLGGPGIYNWKGGLVIMRDVQGKHPFSAVDISRFQKQFDGFSFVGYQVSSGYFFSHNYLLYAYSGPRSDVCKGKIVIGTFKRETEPKYILEGTQPGEYFGSSLAAGDINGDSLDDLIVGAPYYSSDNYNEGRVYIFFGSNKNRMEIPNQNPTINGKAYRGMFGATIMILGDIDYDGYKDVAIAAPYEDEQTGVVYIYRGNDQGLSSTPCQTIYAKNIAPNLRGFGISIAKPVDIDNNNYLDLAIGSYLSGHAILLRSQPLVILDMNISSVNHILDRKSENFTVSICLWFTGKYLPNYTTGTITVDIDIDFQRAHINNAQIMRKSVNITNIQNCEDITIFLKKNLTKFFEPIPVTVSQELQKKPPTKSPITVANDRIITKNDKINPFCKKCPILDIHKSKLQQTINLPFSLGCGDDNICTSDLKVDAWFPNMKNNTFIIGSNNVEKLEIIVENFKESAYLTQLEVEFPKIINLKNIPINCHCKTCANANAKMLKLECELDNPLDEKKKITTILDLDMKRAGLDYSGNQSREINFEISVFTSSKDDNPENNMKILPLRLITEADIAISGNSGQYSISYGNIDDRKLNFTQLYEVHKYGKSPLDEVLVQISIPTYYRDDKKQIDFLHIYKPEGSYAGQPISCTSDIKYLEYIEADNVEQDLELNEVPDNSISTEIENSERQKRAIKKEENFQSSLTLPPSNRTLFLNCSTEEVICSTIQCIVGPMKQEKHSITLQLNMVLDIGVLEGITKKKDILYLSTDGMVVIKSPPNFIQSGDKGDFTRLSNIFVGRITVEKIDALTFIIGISIGLLIILMIVMGLMKAGFFKREKRDDLKRIMAEEGMQDDNNTRKSTEIEECPDDDNEGDENKAVKS